MRLWIVFVAFFILLKPDSSANASVSEYFSFTPQITLTNADSRITELLNEGLKFLSEGETDLAKQRFNQAASLAPNDPTPLLALAKTELVEDNKERVFRNINRAKSIAPNSTDVLVSLARFYQSSKQLGLAERTYQKALNNAEQKDKIYTDLGYLYLARLDRPESAITHFDSALAISSDSIGALYGRGLALAELAKFEQALMSLNQAASLAKNDSDIFLTIGKIQISLEQPQLALTAFDKGLTSASQSIELLLARAALLKSIGELERAKLDLASAIEISPENLAPLTQLAVLAHEQKDYDLASTTYERVLELSPNNIIALNNLAWLYAETATNLDTGLKMIRKALILGNQNPVLLDTLGWVYRARGELEQAENAYDLALAKLAKPSAVTYYYAGIVKQERQKANDAVAAFRLALETDANFEHAADAQQRITKLTGND